MLNFNEPLGMPQGTVRAIVTLILILALVALVFMGKTSSYLEVLASAAFGYYFAQRAAETSGTPKGESDVPVTFAQPEEEEVTVVSGKDL